MFLSVPHVCVSPYYSWDEWLKQSLPTVFMSQVTASWAICHCPRKVLTYLLLPCSKPLFTPLSVYQVWEREWQTLSHCPLCRKVPKVYIWTSVSAAVPPMRTFYSAEDVSLPFRADQQLHKPFWRREWASTLQNKRPIDQSRLNKVKRPK